MSLIKKEFASEANILFTKLIHMREDIYKGISSIIDSHSNSLQDGISDLMQEIQDLQAKHVLIVNERDDLLQTNDMLKFEMKKLQAPQLNPD